MKVIISVLLFFSSALVCHAESTSEYDTPFLTDFRKRLEANDKTPARQFVVSFAIDICAIQKKCTKKDLIAIKKLAEKGDTLGLIIYPFAYASVEETGPDIWDLMVYAANKGEPYYKTLYGLRNEDYAIGEKYILEVLSDEYYIGYIQAISFYEKHQKKAELCSIVTQGIKQFGIQFIASNYSFINKNTEKINVFNSCISIKEYEKMLNKAGDEGQLIYGFKNIANQKYQEAFKIFSKIYKSGDKSQIPSNAGYCLGMMNYYGKGIKKSLKNGQALLQESFDNGVMYPDTPEIKGMPKQYKIQSYIGNTCSTIK